MQSDVKRVNFASLAMVAVTAFNILFLLAFTISEFDGLVALAGLLTNAIGAIPRFLQTIFDYYRAVSTDHLLPSVLIGAVLGGLLTAAGALAHHGVWKLPSLRVAWVVLPVLIGLLYAGAGFGVALLLGLVALLGLGYAVDPTWREFLTFSTLRGLQSRQAAAIWLRGAVWGALVGGVGSQLFAYPLQHCTFAAEAPTAQYRLGLVLTGFGVLVVLVPLWTLLFGGLGRVNTAGYFQSRLTPYLLLAPTLLAMGVFLYYPAVQIITLSTKARRFPLPQERFVCLENYVNLANDQIYRSSITTTAFISLMLVILTMSTALFIAVLASQKVRGAGVYRSLLIWPFALSPVVAGLIFLSMFREGGAGVINYALDSTLGIQPRWLRDADLAPWVVILASVWNGLGFNILFYIAGLQNVPEDLLDAASIDGANRVQRFFRITLPLLSPYNFFLLVANMTYAFYGIYGVVDAITQGGPPLGPAGSQGGATKVLIYKLYEDGFTAGGSAGSAAAQSLILFLLVAGLTILQFRYVENRVTYNA